MDKINKRDNDRLTREEVLDQYITELERENERLRDWLQFIKFSSQGVPTVLNDKDVPKKWQDEISRVLNFIGGYADEAMSGVPGPGQWQSTEI